MFNSIFPIVTEGEKKLPFYITSTGSSENQDHILRPEGYPGFHLLYCTSGEGRLLIEGKDYKIPSNSGFFFYPGIPHEYYAEISPWTTWWITFDGYAVKDLVKYIGFGTHGVFHISDMEKLHKLHKELHIEVSRSGLANVYTSSVLLYKFLLEFRSLVRIENIKKRNINSRHLKQVLHFIEENYGQSISLNDMSEVAGVTPQHLCRLFRKAFNMRPVEYLTMLRLKKAKELLVNPDNLTLNEIGKLTGFNDTSYFCSVFKRYEGVTALEFKRMHKEF